MSTVALTTPLAYKIDPAHSTVRFWVRHLMVAKVHGAFNALSGSVILDPTRPEEAKVEAIIETASVSTGQDQRDEHLRSADFFDAASYPTIEFRSTEVRKTRDGLQVVGLLSLHGVTKEVVLQADVTDEIPSPFGGYKIGVSATGVLNREDFGMTFNQILETGGVAVGKEVHIQLDVELDRP
jgi:polyisoprenoid-binding protein YceI